MNTSRYLKAALGFIIAPALVLILLGVLSAQTYPAHATGEGFIVDNSGDDPTKTLCTESTNDCSLRGAILSANMTTDVTIHFGVDHVDLSSSLPAITGARTWIDGTTVLPRINANGMSSGDVFTINADDVTLSNLVIYNTPPGKAEIYVPGGHDARIAYNYLGVLPEATDCSSLTRQGGIGINIDTTAGGPGDSEGAAYVYDNVIGCHTNHGIGVYDSKYVYIGMQPDGVNGGPNYIGINQFDEMMPNQYNGVIVETLGASVMTTTIANNVISGNGWSGIFFVRFLQ